MWISPEGYGSISSTYALGRSGGAGVSPSRAMGSAMKARSASHTACHLASTASGSYRSGSVRVGMDMNGSYRRVPGAPA